MDARRGTRSDRPRYSTPCLAAAQSRALELVGRCEGCYRLVRATVVEGNLGAEACPACGMVVGPNVQQAWVGVCSSSCRQQH